MGGNPVAAQADLGPHAAGFADRLRELTATEEHWVRTEAAHALWAVTGGDTETAVPALVETVRKPPTGRYLPVMLPAVRHLARMGVRAAVDELLAGVVGAQ